MTRVLVVCHGNINRSPLCAAVLARHPELEVRQAALKSWRRPDWRDEPASKKMRDAAIELGLNLERHRSTAISQELLRWAQIVIYMDGGNKARLEAMLDEAGDFTTELRCLGEFADPPVGRIPDPAFIKRGPEFHDVVLLIYRASEALGKKLIARRG